MKITFHLLSALFSKSVFRNCKVSFYPPSIDIVLFYGKYTDIDIDVQYQEIYTDILVLSVFFSIIMKTFKNNFFLFVQMLTDTFLLFLSFKKDHTMLVCCCYWFILERHGMPCLLVFLDIIITYKTYKNAISCSSYSTSSSSQTWSVTKCFLFVFEILKYSVSIF